jgi:DNA-binding transcriptional LysR family regulator
LKHEVGRILLDRHSNGVTLTFDGQQFLQQARAIEARVADAMRDAHRFGPDENPEPARNEAIE